MSLATSLSDAFGSRPDPDAVPVASIAVAVDQHEVVAAWGAQTSTVFQAASISKPVAAMVALRLVAEDRLDLDADVNQFLTSWQLPGDAGAGPLPCATSCPMAAGCPSMVFPATGRTRRFRA